MSEPRSERSGGSHYRGILRDPGPGLDARSVTLSVLLHVATLAALVVGWSNDDDHRPPIDRDAFFVSAVVLPKAEGLPDRATFVPKPAPGEQGEKVEEPIRPDEPVLKIEKKEPKRGPEPPVEQKKEPEPKKPEPKKPSRSDRLAQLGDASDKDRFATDPFGDEDATPSTSEASPFGRPMTKYEKDVHDRVKENWKIHPTLLENVPNGVATIVYFRVAEDGAIEEMLVETPSGDSAFDMSALTAVRRTGRVPPPASAPWEFRIRFRPEDKR